MQTADHEVARHYIQTTSGRLHYATLGLGPTVLCLHQTPRSWDEYREVMRHLAQDRRVIAMDTLGMGQSAPAGPNPTIEQYADAAWALCDALGVEHLDLVGHHTGGVIAIEMAAASPSRVGHLVLSSTPLLDAEARARRQTREPIDTVQDRADGQHLCDLWTGRARFYPPDRVDLLRRFVRDALTTADPTAGHRAVDRYQMERRLDRLTMPVLCVGHDQDPFAYPELSRLADRIPHVYVASIPGGMVPLEHRAEEFAALVAPFLRTNGGTDLPTEGEAARPRPGTLLEDDPPPL